MFSNHPVAVYLFLVLQKYLITPHDLRPEILFRMRGNDGDNNLACLKMKKHTNPFVDLFVSCLFQNLCSRRKNYPSPVS